MENPQLRDQFAGGFSFEYSMELQNAIAEVPYPFKQLGGQNYGVGKLGAASYCNVPSLIVP